MAVCCHIKIYSVYKNHYKKQTLNATLVYIYIYCTVVKANLFIVDNISFCMSPDMPGVCLNLKLTSGLRVRIIKILKPIADNNNSLGHDIHQT